MNPPDPFAYPAAPHTYVHAPTGYTDYGACKPWLRDDFLFRRVYCLTRERWNPSPTGHAGFGTDHLVAQATAPALVVTYANLVYACNPCNSVKGAEPVPLSPLASALADHLTVDAAGTVNALTPEGQDMIDLFALNSPGRTAQRIEKLTLLHAKQAHSADPDIDHLYRRAFGYPDDLPDLALLRPPQGNANVGSEARSHHARRTRGELPDVY